MSTARAEAALPSSWSRLGRNQERARQVLEIVRRRVAKTPELDPITSAEIAALRHVDDRTMPGIRRVGTSHDRYVDPRGRAISSPQVQANHASIHGTVVHFEFRGKSGVSHAIDLHDARLAKIVKACRHLPGHELFQYVDAEGKRQAIGSCRKC